MDIPSWLGLGMGLISFITGGILWYKGSVEKRYAARRDFEHLKRNYAQITEAVNQLDDTVARDVKFISGDLLEIKSSLNETKMMLQFLMSQNSSVSQGMPSMSYFKRE